MGGARPFTMPRAGWCGSETRGVKTIPEAWWFKWTLAEGTKLAATLPRFRRSGDRPGAGSLTARLEALDSSISGRMACRSSVAETTGNSSINAQPRISGQHSERKRPDSRWRTPSRRHINTAGTANSNQITLRSSSIYREHQPIAPSNPPIAQVLQDTAAKST